MDLPNSIIIAFVGFVLTTVAGGLLGAFLQNRLWRHQWLAQRRCKTQEEARTVFEDVSRLMDRRLFRLHQLKTWILRGDRQRVETALGEYRDIMREWNDLINRTISLLHFYFGRDMRERFDSGVGKAFVDIGASVEVMYRNIDLPGGHVDETISASIEQLRAQVYDYNLSLLNGLDQMSRNAEPSFSFAIFSAGPKKA